MGADQAPSVGTVDRSSADVLSPRRTFSPLDVVGYVDDESAPEEVLAFMLFVFTRCEEGS